MQLPRHLPARRDGLTLVELLVATTIGIIISAGLYAFVQAGMIVGIRSLAINNTGSASRLSLDQAEQLLQVAYDAPIPIQKNGTKLTTENTPAAGVRFFRYVGGPYEVDIPSGGLSGNTKTLNIFCRNQTSTDSGGAPPAPPRPLENDVLVINTTILMSGRSSQIYAYVSSITGTRTETRKNAADKNVVGTRYTVSLKDTLTGNNSSIPSGSTSTITAVLIRPTALLVVPNAGNRELRLYESFPNDNTLNINRNFRVLTDQIAWERNTTSASTDDAFSTPFFIRKVGERTFVNSNFRVRNTRYDRFLRHPERNEFSTFNGLSSRVPVKCNPNE